MKKETINQIIRVFHVTGAGSFSETQAAGKGKSIRKKPPKNL